MTRLLDQNTNLNIFNNHIMRSKWNYQFTKEFSLRLIGQYITTIANPGSDHAAKLPRASMATCCSPIC